MPKSISPQRLERFRQVVEKRQLDWIVVLENIVDGHNLGAVLRSCDAVGVQQVFILQTEEDLRFKKVKIGQKTSAGGKRWLSIRYFYDRESCFEALRKIVDKVYCSQLVEESLSLYDLPMHESHALVFGNEHEGLSPQTAALCDASFKIPMYGLAQSLNISVACAVSLYTGLQEREKRGMYAHNNSASPQEKQLLLAQYQKRHEES